ncbi:toprim domain-containing protein [Anaerostipes sp.]|uniref:toprim domain-containing protein n=1 Tax=Anaerostipes sp. TaxID=1872530 RepID=UPI00257DE73D|nr:toprim domain-containing protein [Anaerostipes sp.]MBS6279187.1 toprim domain-containing protein [Anaerostipes sp.]
MPYIHFTEDQKLRANSVDLVEFLRRQGEKLISSGQDKRLTSDHSITVHGNEWYDHAAERGGHAISFVQNFYGLTYPEAVTRLLNGEQGEVYVPAEKKEKEPPKEFALPPSNQTMRRVYAYLLQQRHISREVLSAFAQKGLIYESREGSDTRCSFHWVGTSDRLYVFEAPIDLLAFLTLYPDGWQQHSYVALCGTAGHAMLWMLEKNPNLRKAILCLDHDAAGIEAVGRLSEVLREHGYSQIAPLQSEYKDWDEDLKARHGLEAQPAEEHPQFAVAGLVCRRIGARCKEVQPDRAVYQFPGLLLRYRNDLHWGRFDQAMERMETMAALALSVVLRECKQMGTALTTEQGVRFLESHILPHQNRGILKNRADEIAMQFQSVLAKNNCRGIRTQAEKKEVASAWLELAISCAKVPVKYEADEIKRRQKEEKTQREAEPVMA